MKKLSLFLIIFFIVLFIGELVLQRKYTPGYQTHYSDFKIVDSLIVYEDYETDIFGNYILGSLIRDSVKSIYDYNNCSIANKQIENKIANADGIKKILEDFCKLKNILIPNNEFEFFSSSLLKQSKLDKSDSACLAYLNYPFNQEGFRSIEFDNYKSNKIKVLLIGDSFVWGMTAKPYYNSFADILLARNYQVFNAGIASVDPIQYWGICKNYFDKIDPDLVIVNFFEGNDLITKERIYGENLPH
ncbi:MAG: SGNH/GDSL hydrolase family protein, partial [Bacteroidetes bacterium]|nr:SGNH/GDSL hydrolase family protein [Bacteroidota bacterium]